MNIFKKIKTANELLSIYLEVKTVLANTHLSENIKKNVEIIKQALENMGKEIAVINKLKEIIFKK